MGKQRTKPGTAGPAPAIRKDRGRVFLARRRVDGDLIHVTSIQDGVCFASRSVCVATAAFSPDERNQESSSPVTSTFFRNKPFVENVEGLSHCGNGSCGSQIVFK